MKFYGHRYKIARVGTCYVAVIRGEGCFEKNAFEDAENPHPPTKTQLLVKEYLGEIFEISKKIYFVLKLFLQPIIFHGKLSFDNLTYFKLYGNLNCLNKRIFLGFVAPFLIAMSKFRDIKSILYQGERKIVKEKWRFKISEFEINSSK